MKMIKFVMHENVFLNIKMIGINLNIINYHSSFIIRVGGIGITVFILFTRYLYGKEVSIVQNFFNFCVNRSELSSRFLWWFLWFLFFLRLLCFFHWFRRLLWWFCQFCWFCWRLWWFFGCCRFRFLWCLLSFIWCRDWFPVLEKIIRI